MRVYIVGKRKGKEGKEEREGEVKKRKTKKITKDPCYKCTKKHSELMNNTNTFIKKKKHSKKHQVHTYTQNYAVHTAAPNAAGHPRFHKQTGIAHQYPVNEGRWIRWPPKGHEWVVKTEQGYKVLITT